MIITFWNEQHPLSQKAQELFEKLVPGDGYSDSLQGELLRASMRINYDWFNNGWGCNNWSGAVNFIETNFTKLPNLPDDMFVQQLMKELHFVHQYSHGEPCNYRHGGTVCTTVTKIHEIIVNAVLANPKLIANKEDMFDYQEEDYIPNYDDEEEEYNKLVS